MSSILDMLKKRFAGAPRHMTGPQPARDWYILLIATALLIAASIGWNMWLFARVAEGDLGEEQAAGNVLKTYPAGAIGELFEDRREMEAAYRSSFPFVDPSR